MASSIDIVNSALIKIGADRVTSLTENNKRAIFSNEQYPKIRKRLLRSHPWNFAIKRVALAATVNVPLFDFTVEYQLPADVLRVLKTDDNRIPHKIEGDKLLSDAPTMNIQYIADVTDVSKMDENFKEALAFQLAADLAYAIVQSSSLASNMFNLAEAALKEARTFDAQEGTPDDLIEDQWINSRK